MKKTSTFQNGLIWFGAGVSLAEILTGTAFAPLGMAKGFAAILLGHIIGCAMMLLAGLIGGRTGRSAEQVTEFLRDVIQPVLDANAEDVGQHVELNV